MKLNKQDKAKATAESAIHAKVVEHPDLHYFLLIQRYGYELMDMFDEAVDNRQWDAFFERVDEFEEYLINNEGIIRDSE
jgi:hypothetical protein